jgi:uncharacterized protein (DUF934 family)
VNTVIRLTGIDLADPWQRLPEETAPPLAGEYLLLPLPCWQESVTKEAALNGRPLGLWLDPGAKLETLLGWSMSGNDAPDLIAISFPQFTDGRGYTLARLLRERLGYAGELRAVGPLVADVLFYLHRCGFDSFQPTGLLAGQAEKLLAHLASMLDRRMASHPYQGAVIPAAPLFNRMDAIP